MDKNSTSFARNKSTCVVSPFCKNKIDSISNPYLSVYQPSVERKYLPKKQFAHKFGRLYASVVANVNSPLLTGRISLWCNLFKAVSSLGLGAVRSDTEEKQWMALRTRTRAKSEYMTHLCWKTLAEKIRKWNFEAVNWSGVCFPNSAHEKERCNHAKRLEWEARPTTTDNAFYAKKSPTLTVRLSSGMHYFSLSIYSRRFFWQGRSSNCRLKLTGQQFMTTHSSRPMS